MKAFYFLQNNSNQRERCSSMLRTLTVLVFTLLSTQLFSQTTVTFDYTGAEQTWTVPSGVTSIDIEVWGAQGGKGFLNAPGGLGGYASGTLAVTPGQTLYIYAGGKGGSHASELITGGGFNGGGHSRGGNHLVGAGGGGSDVRTGGNSFADRVIVGGGGGGACGTSYTGGNGGGTAGDQGANAPGDNPGGGGGTQNTGGISSSCEDGTFGIGGSSSINAQCAGGGGGWYGGAAACGAGGGSGYIGGVVNGTMNNGVRYGDGLVKFTYVDNSPFPNDDCPDPTEILCNSLISGSTIGATPDFPSCSNHPNPGGGLWYYLIGTGEEVTISTHHSGTNFNTRISVFAGFCDELICVTEEDGPGDFSTVTFFAAAGGFYRILIDGPNGSEGFFELSVTCGNPCENAIPLTCHFPEFGSNGNVPISSSPVCGNVPNGNGVWYSFTGNDQCVLLSTCDASGGATTTFDTQLSVYSGTCGNLSCVAYNDNANDGSSETCDTDYPSTLFLFAEAGTNYFVLVHGVNGETGNFILDYVCFDRPPLEITCPTDITLECNQFVPTAATSLIEFEAIGGSVSGGSCSISSYTISHQDFSFDCPSSGINTTRVYTIENNESGETKTCTQDFFCASIPPLEVICPPDVTIECNESLPPQAMTVMDFMNQGGTITGGRCPGPGYSSYNITVYDGTTDTPICESQTWTRYYTVTSTLTGESINCSQQILKNPAPLPTIFSNGPVTISCYEDLLNINFEDLVTITFPNPGCIPSHEIRSSDLPDPILASCNGNQVTMFVAVEDECHRIVETAQIFNVENAGTQVIVAPDEIVECADDISVDVTDIQVTQPCGFNTPSIQIDGPDIADAAHPNCSGNTFTYSYSFTDACGEFYQYKRVFTIENEGTQVIESPDETVECAEDISFGFGDLQVTAPCGILIEVLLAGPFISNPQHPNCSGTTHTYTQSFTDECGVAHQYDKVYTIQNDPISLVKVNPELDDIENNSTVQLQCYGLDPNWSIPQYDESSFAVITSCDLVASIEYQFIDLGAADCTVDGYVHRYQHIWIAQDECGTTDQFSFKVEIVDNIAPVLSGVPADLTIDCSQELPALTDVIALDECLCAHISFSETELLSSICSGDKTIVRTWTAVDHCGNTTSTSQYISIEDNTAPVLSLVSANLGNIENGSLLTAGCSVTEYPYWLFELNENSVDVFDLCSDNASVSFNMESDISYSCTTSGYLEKYTPSWAVTDDCGNTSYFSFSLQVVDNTAPQFFGSEVLYLCDGFEHGNAVAIDDCSNTEVSYMESMAQNCGPGVFKRIYYITDDCQNTTTAEQLVIDLSQNPELITLATSLNLEDVVYECELNSENYSGMSEDDVVPMISCLTDLEITFSETLIPNSCDNGGSKLQLLWIATTPCGYVDQLEYFIDVVDNAAPYFPDFQSEMELTCGDPMPVVIAEDDCNSVSLNIVENVENGDCPGESIITRTITATDICGNATTATQLIFMVDNEGPVFDLENSVCENEVISPVLAFDECSENHIEATLVSEQTINQCTAFPIVEKTWKAEDHCGNLTEFVQLVYPLNYQLQYEVLDAGLNNLIDDNISVIQKSDNFKMNVLHQLGQTAVIAYDPCGEPVIGDYSKNTIQHEACQDGIGEIITFTWNFAEACGEVYAYSISFDIDYDIAPVIEVEEDLSIYCTDVLPELVISEEEGVEYSVLENDLRDENGDGDVIREITATDVCGNTSYAYQTIHVYYTSDLSAGIDGNFSPPCSSSGNLYTVEVSGGTAPYTINWSVIGGNCSIEQVFGNSVEIYIGFGLATIRAEVIDANGCMTESKATVSCHGAGYFNNSDTPTNEQKYSDELSVNGASINLSNGSLSKENAQISLYQNQPNPFLDKTVISFSLEQAGRINLTIYDTNGRTVKVIEEFYDKGFNEVLLNRNEFGTAGVYFYRLRTDKEAVTKSMIVLE